MAKGPVMTMSRWEDAADWGRTTRGAAGYRKYFYFDQSVGTRQAVSPLSCPTLCDPMVYRAHGILQARILEWVAFPFSRGSSQLTIKAFFRKEPKSWFISHLPHSSAPHSICLHFHILHIFSKTKGGKYIFLTLLRKKKKEPWGYWKHSSDWKHKKATLFSKNDYPDDIIKWYFKRNVPEQNYSCTWPFTTLISFLIYLIVLSEKKMVLS